MIGLASSLVIFISYQIADCLDVSIHINGSERIGRRVDEDLNLYCSVTLQVTHSARFAMEWLLPSISANRKRVSVQEGYNQILLRVVNLQAEDSGDYVCQATSLEFGTIRKNVTVIVKQKKGACPDNHFRCTYTGHCIPKRYLCDGFNDCIDATDESPAECGTDPCDGKIRCNDGRCLDRQLCCDPYVEPSCPTSHLLPCCMRFIHSMYNHIHPSVEQQRRYDSDLGFLQSTIYTVIGCAVAFVFIVTVMVIAVCRVHMRRSAMTPHTRPRGVASVAPNNTMPLTPGNNNNGALTWDHRRMYDDGGFGTGLGTDPYLYGATPATPTNSANLLVTYNIGNGIQFVGRLVKPPSYSEIVTEPTAPEGPPPPYCSTDNLHRQPAQLRSPSDGGRQEQCVGNELTPTPSPTSQYTSLSPGFASMLRPNIIVNRLSDSD